MPWISADDFSSAHYREPRVNADTGAMDVDVALAQKKHWTHYREEMLAYKKICGRDDREGARFFDSMASDAMKHIRGWQYVLSVIACEPPGDCKNIEMSEPISPYADWAFSQLDLSSGG